MPEPYVVIYEDPEGSPRPRAWFMQNKGNNILSNARSNSAYTSSYSTGAADRQFMKQFKTTQDFDF